jgi:mono/diheme cytochrome c family protein
MRDMIASRSARPALLGAVLVTAGGVAWYCFLPPSAAATLASAAVLNVLMALIFALTVIVFFLLYLGPYRNPGWLSPGFAASLCLFGIAAFATGEFIREAVRKPFAVHNVVLANQISPTEVRKLQQSGYLQGGLWTRAFVAEQYPQAVVDGRIDAGELLKLPPRDRLVLGKTLFLYHCNDCHAADLGYSAVGPLLHGRPRAQVLSLVEHLDDNLFMPPWCSAKPEEAQLIADYLRTISPSRPAGVRHFMKSEGGEEEPE